MLLPTLRINGFLHTALPYFIYSYSKRTSNGVRSLPLVGWNLLLHLDTYFRIILSDKCLNLLLEVKCILQDGCPCWQDGCLQIWQNPGWQKQDGCSHGKKPCCMTASSPIARTMLEMYAVLSSTEFFNVIQSAQMDICPICSFQMQMLQYPDTLYILLGTVDYTKECVTSAYPVEQIYYVCCAKQGYWNNQQQYIIYNKYM